MYCLDWSASHKSAFHCSITPKKNFDSVFDQLESLLFYCSISPFIEI